MTGLSCFAHHRFCQSCLLVFFRSLIVSLLRAHPSASHHFPTIHTSSLFSAIPKVHVPIVRLRFAFPKAISTLLPNLLIFSPFLKLFYPIKIPFRRPFIPYSQGQFFENKNNSREHVKLRELYQNIKRGKEQILAILTEQQRYQRLRFKILSLSLSSSFFENSVVRLSISFLLPWG